MIKPFLLFRGPVKTRSGYGAHSRDLLEALYKMDLFNIKIDSCGWGSTPLTALEEGNEFHKWINDNIITSITEQPEIYIQVTVPNEFQRVGKFNIGVTAGIETTVAPKNWVDGCNKMDHIITTSTFSRDVLLQTVYNETENTTGKLIKQHRIEKPISVLFEGVDTSIYNNEYKDVLLPEIKQYNSVPMHVGFLLFILKTLHYTFPIISQQTYATYKRYIFNNILLQKRDAVFLLLKQR
jgi:hypothetical protein